jgi:LmbE family N-acetylglucosaminyl deacetylase
MPLPSLDECESILCVQPHPDDNEVGAGATIAKLAKNGCRVTYLTVTDGRIGTMDPAQSPESVAEVRKAEIDAAAKILGVSGMISLGYADASYIDEKELTQRIVSVIREVKPEFVMTADPFLPYEAHPDHRRVGMAAAEACLFSMFPHFHSFGETCPSQNIWAVSGVAFYNTAYPNTFINVDETWSLKIDSIAAHKSQFGGEGLEMLKMYFEYKAMQLAQGRGFGHAEGFKVLTPTLLHVNVDAINL